MGAVKAMPADQFGFKPDMDVKGIEKLTKKEDVVAADFWLLSTVTQTAKHQSDRALTL